ncbi:Uncharacterised protein [Listeria grayi]|uniref:DUF4064 domain-containing protein n=3 Tax=Listeria grayi TaxID=1641 RepID=D7UV00_LISGR|nr:DUF4064 domain-containing protein [Listeria grayi]EFI85076.1 hypothetical protein HMPREF0556_10275 [Listeria grayi DSM 20601]EUJ28609.1 hypothetical protein LMUR_05902 [Listeria grayi FSL F6-1183]MBC1921931.1 DUF4064 domain-containing protein [Listeria grayi]VEI30302.1 Uncharacterised protein [Listeria grayi]
MKVEGLLGFLGAALGIGFSLMVLTIPGISQALEEESFVFYMLNIATLLLSAVGLIGAFVVPHRARLGGALMVASAIGCTMSVSILFLLPIVLLAVGGLIALISHEESTVNE